MGRRPADDRHAEPGDRDGAGAASPPSSASRRRTSHLRSPFLGGGFGSKAILAGPQILAILAARMLGPAGQAGAAAATRCSGPWATAAPRGSVCGSGMDADGRLTALEHHARRDDEQLRRLHRAGGERVAQPLCQPRDLDPARRRCGSTSARRARCGRRAKPRGSAALECAIDEAAAGLRARSAGVPPAQLRRGRSGLGQAVLVQGAARVLRRRAPSGSAGPGGRSRRGRCATRPGCLVGWGMGTRALPRADVPGRGARDAARRRHRAGRDLRRRHGPGRLDGAGADRRRRARARHRPGRVPRRLVRPSRRRHRRRLGPYRDGGRRALQCRQRRRRQARRARHQPTRTRRCSAPAMPGSRRAAAGSTTAATRDRSESYADILARAGLADARGTRPRRPRSGQRRGPGDVLARRGLRRGQGRPRSRPGPGHAGSSAPSRPGGSSTRGWRAASSTAG